MKPSFLIFFAIVIVVWGAANYYVFVHGWKALSDFPLGKKIYLATFIFFSLAFLAGRIWENYSLNVFVEFLICTGSTWMAVILYAFLCVLLLDAIILINRLIHIFPLSFYDLNKTVIFFISVTVIFLLVAYGYINASNPVTNKFNLKIDKNISGSSKLKILAASDIHLGTIIGAGQLTKLIQKAESERPDLILLAGDIIDEDIRPVIKNNIGQELVKLKAKFGVYGILGNHEYIGGAEEALKYLTEHNVTILRDSVVLLENGIYIIGRDDRSKKGFSGNNRKSLEELVRQYITENDSPVILMDHQPFNLNEAVKNKVDLQLSGHTHHGQLFPFNYITEIVYELSRGYLQKENTHFIVSTGFGTWGPRVRIGNRPEMIIINIEFK